MAVWMRRNGMCGREGEGEREGYGGMVFENKIDIYILLVTNSIGFIISVIIINCYDHHHHYY